MPEGPEVALTAQILEKKLRGCILQKIKFVSGRYGDPGRSKPDGFEEFVRSLKEESHFRLSKVDSKGKFMWFRFKSEESDQVWYVWNTFGLTGMWSFTSPKYTRAILTFFDRSTKISIPVYYSDMRNFGTFKFSNNIHELDSKLGKLGPDVLKDESISLTFLRNYKGPIVKALTDQKKLSGIGNYLSAEILYKAKISPHRPANSLTVTEIKTLKYCIKYVTKLAYVNNDIGYMVNLKYKIKKKNYHPDIDVGNAKFEFNVYGRNTDLLGNKITAEKIIPGRTTYWVKGIQK